MSNQGQPSARQYMRSYQYTAMCIRRKATVGCFRWPYAGNSLRKKRCNHYFKQHVPPRWKAPGKLSEYVECLLNRCLLNSNC
ncbi:hypothetical protein TTRE_0000249501 [Trichuris trichiura]|uniref:Uncharacterized protein n=1 Tax=Trichuris trichiura TaxID=36087 RepID=A0A077Z6E2_TRITR|nr:hypothetical protein TTRE_0000249501 [Trichuris trichiura]